MDPASQSAKTSFIRAVTEAVKIRNFKGTLLNSKQEYRSCRIPELEAPRIREKQKRIAPKNDIARIINEMETEFTWEHVEKGRSTEITTDHTEGELGETDKRVQKVIGNSTDVCIRVQRKKNMKIYVTNGK